MVTNLPKKVMLSAVLLFAVAGCGSGGLTDTPTTSSSSSTPATGDTMPLSACKSADGGATYTTATQSVSVDSPAKLTVIVKNSDNTPVAGKVVSFSSTFDLSFNPSSGTALTDANGNASVIVNAGNTTGAATIDAATTNTTGGAVTGSIALSVDAPNLTLSALTINPSTLSAGGSASVGVTILDASGNPFPTSVPVSFTSNGTEAGMATITSQVYTVNGVASATYKDTNYASTDTITATLSIGGTTFTKNGTITVNPAAAGSISFQSATPANIALKGTGGVGRSETSTVVFKVLDTNGNPINKLANFSLTPNTAVGGLSLSNASATSDPGTGEVQTILQAGTISTPIRVSATINGTNISTVSDLLVISTGIPDQDSFSLSATTLNIEGWNYDGVTTDVTARLADHFNNPAPDGTAVNFITSGGSVGASCVTTGGVCTVKFTSQNPRPANGRTVVLAYALGEESFKDNDGDGIYKSGTADSFDDVGEPYLDADEDGIKGATEFFIDTNWDGAYSLADGRFNGILRDISITAATTIHARGSLTIVMSGSYAVITGIANPTALPVCTNGVAFVNTPVEFDVSIKDINGNAMSAGTTITLATKNGTILTPTNYTVYNTSSLLPAPYHVVMESDATQDASTLQCTNAKKTGFFTVTVKTPKGNETTAVANVTD